MNYWILVLSLNLLIPMFMLVYGTALLKRPPERGDWGFGYRTKYSMESQEAWDFAQRHFGLLCCRLGMLMASGTIAAMVLLGSADEECIGNAGMLLGTVEGMLTVYALLPTERALRQKFDKRQGN